MAERGRSILLVDDDAGVRESLAAMLRHEGHEVITARDGEQALGLLRKGPLPDVILLDLMMPVLSGWEFLDVKAREAALREVPVVLMTGYTEQGPPLRNVLALLTKPLDMAQLRTMLRHL